MKREGKYKYLSDIVGQNEQLIPTVIVQFHVYPDLWMTLEEYEGLGKFKGLLQSFHISIKDVRHIYKPLKYASSYPTGEWEP